MPNRNTDWVQRSYYYALLSVVHWRRLPASSLWLCLQRATVVAYRCVGPRMTTAAAPMWAYVRIYYTPSVSSRTNVAAMDGFVAVTTSNKEHGAWDDGAAAAAAQSFDFIRFTLSDINGVSRSTLVPARHVHDALTNGIGVCSSKRQIAISCA